MISRYRAALPNPWLKSLIQVLVRLRLVWIILLALLMLSGCVRYDAGVRFHSPTQGEILQHISLDNSLTAFNGSTAQQWFNSLEQRTRQLEGRVQRLSPQELVVTIPFQNGADLVAKFNQFFSTSGEAGNQAANPLEALPEVASQFSLKQNNLLLLQRNHLVFDLDLRSLGVLAANGQLLASPGSLLNLEFNLQTPWGARSLGPTKVRQSGTELSWTLEPGQINHLEAVFWLPDLLGIGTVAIALLCGAGFYFKYRFPAAASPSTALSE